MDFLDVLECAPMAVEAVDEDPNSVMEFQSLLVI
jgi:hypothetical protein